MQDPLASIPTPYDGLQVRATDLFPLDCPRCQRRFTDIHDYVARTTPVCFSPGLTQRAEPDGTFVLLQRNCLCGSSLALQCLDRRSRTTDGIRRRHRFDSLVNLLVESGLAPRRAETEVRRLLAAPKP